MKCPACGAENPNNTRKCAQCGARMAARVPRTPAMALAHAAMWAVSILFTIVIAGLLFYRIYFWIDASHVENYYARANVMEPIVEEITQPSGLLAHAITFFGDDGDTIFIKELRQSYVMSGGLTRVEIPDSQWFGADAEDTQAAEVTLTPVLYTEGGAQIELPALNITIPTPESPLTLINPPDVYERVSTSMYLLRFRVVPGSTVLVGAQDVSDSVNYEGLLEVNVQVFPQGDNNVSLLVSTPNHKQTRRDINLYRAYQEINLEPDMNLSLSTNRKSFTVRGTIDADALLSVDTPYEEDSIEVKENGSFSFRAKMSVIGDNQVTFRASQAGKQDSVVSLTVYYVPNVAAYSAMAWVMDYDALSLYYETWHGRVFLCEGVVTEVTMTEDDEQLVVMDVGKQGAPQYVVLVNHSEVGTPTVGSSYRAYADVLGNEFYADKYCPKLACRYMLAPKAR